MIGINIGPIGYGYGENPYNDLMRLTQYTVDPNNSDSNGYPLHVNSGNTATFYVDSGIWRTSSDTLDYVILYDGTGTFSKISGATIISNQPNRIVIRLTTLIVNLYLVLSYTDPNNNLRNIRIVPLSLESNYQTNKWRQSFVDRWKKYQVWRFMDLMKTNGFSVSVSNIISGKSYIIANVGTTNFISQFGANSNISGIEFIATSNGSISSGTGTVYNSSLINWSDRVPIAYCTALKGMPIEDIISLSNYANISPWICIPHLASDDYITGLATYIRDNLNSGLKVWIEYSNEVWNGSFAQEHFALSQCSKFGIDQYQWYAYRATQCMVIFENVFGNTSRIKRIMGTQFTNSWITNRILTYGTTLQHIDSIAIGYYVGKELGSTSVIQQTMNNSISQNIDVLRNTYLPTAVDNIIQHKNFCSNNNVELICYEAGQHIVADTSTTSAQNIQQNTTYYIYKTGTTDFVSLFGAASNNVGTQFIATSNGTTLSGNGVVTLTQYGQLSSNTQVINTLAAINRDPGMYQFYFDMYNAFRNISYGIILWYTSNSKYANYGYWGLLETTSFGETPTYKYSAVEQMVVLETTNNVINNNIDSLFLSDSFTVKQSFASDNYYALRVFNFNGTFNPNLPIQDINTGATFYVIPNGLSANIQLGTPEFDANSVKIYGDGSALANCTFIDCLNTGNGQYIDNQGHLSSFNILQNENYNNYTYKISVEKELVKYKQILMNLLHPSGTKMVSSCVIKSNTTKYNLNSYNTYKEFSKLPISRYTGSNTTVSLSVDFFDTSNTKSSNILKFNNTTVNIFSYFNDDTIIELNTLNGKQYKTQILNLDTANNIAYLKENVWLTFCNVYSVITSNNSNSVVVNYLTDSYNKNIDSLYSNTQLLDFVSISDNVYIPNNGSNSINKVLNIDYTNNIIYLETTLTQNSNSTYLSINKNIFNLANVNIISSDINPILADLYVALNNNIDPTKGSYTYYKSNTSNSTFFNYSSYIDVAINNPRFGYHPTTKQYLGYLSENSGSNLFTNSETIYGGNGITVYNNAIINFNNTLTCDLITETPFLSSHYGNNITLSNCNSGQYCFQIIIKNYSSDRNIALKVFNNQSSNLLTSVVFNPVTKSFVSTYSNIDIITDYGYMQLSNGFIMVYMVFNHTTNADSLLIRRQLYNGNNSIYLGNISSGMYIGGTEFKYSKYSDSYIYNTSGNSQRDNESLYINYQLPTNDFTIYTEWTQSCFSNTCTGTIFQSKNISLNGNISLDYYMYNNTLSLILSKNTNLNTTQSTSNTVIFTDNINYSSPFVVNYKVKKIALRFSSNNSNGISGMDMFINGKKCIGNTDNSPCLVDSKFTIGNDYSNKNADYSYHKNFQIFNKVLSDTKIINLTSI